MYNMVEEVPSSSDLTPKLLFLTNSQADLLAGSSASLQRMLNALEIPKPKLVINLLCSYGFRDWTNSQASFVPTKYAGAVKGRAPFLSQLDEDTAEARVDNFMSTVIIPLAVKTQAIILCSATPCNCMLSSSLTRMYAVQRSKWGSKAPFTILSCTGFTAMFYLNPNPKAHWRTVREASQAWQNRDNVVLSCAKTKYQDADGNMPFRAHDLDPNGICFIVVDAIDSQNNVCDDRRSYNHLITELVRHLASQLPSLAIKTGYAGKTTLDGATTMSSGLGVAMEAAQSGTPLMFLDVRNRLPLQVPEGCSGLEKRKKLIEAAQKRFEEECDTMLEQGLTESFDVCAISWLRDVLKGDGDTSTTEITDDYKSTKNSKQVCSSLVPLHEAIARAQDDTRDASNNEKIPVATNEQIDSVSRWFSHRVFKDAWQVILDREEREAQGQNYISFYRDRIFAQTTMMRTILESPNFHHLNLTDKVGAKRLVQYLVKLDRLPKQNSLEALQLLREAWCSYDVVMLLASKSKCWSKFLFSIQLLVAWFIVVGSTLKSQLSYGDSLSVSGRAQVPALHLSSGNISSARADNVAFITNMYSIAGHVVFGLAVLATFLKSLESAIDTKARWRHLRSSAGTLQSLVWSFRTRIGPFAINKDITKRIDKNAEMVFCMTLKNWSQQLLAGADLASSALGKEYKSSTYKHYQWRSRSATRFPRGQQDDYYSLVQPQRYVEMRINPTMKFYQGRIPSYKCRKMCIRLFLVLCSVTTAILAHYELEVYVVAVTSAAAGMVSWSEFSDIERKMTRYTKAIYALKELLYWWMALGEVEKANMEIISRLIETGESIINNERIAWVSTAKKEETESAGDGDEGQGSFFAAASRSSTRKGSSTRKTTVAPLL